MRDAKYSEDPRMLQILIIRNRHFDEKGRIYVEIRTDAFASISLISSLDVVEKRRTQQSGVLPPCSHKACFREVIGAHVPHEKLLAWNARSTDSYHV